MPTTKLKDARAIAIAEPFRQLVEAAIVQAALDIQSEDAATKNHAERSALAYQVLHGAAGYSKRFAMAVALDDQCTDKALDATLAARVAAVWDAFALGGS